MTAHPIDDDEESGLVGDCDGDAILIVLAISDQTYFGMLNLQALAPAAVARNCYTYVIRGWRFISPRKPLK